MTPRICTSVLVGVLGLSLGACGSSGAGKLSRAELDGKANAICKKATDQGNAVPQPTSIGDPNQATTYLGRVAPIADTELSDLQALKPEDSLKADWGDFVSKVGQATQLVDTALQKARAKDQSGLQDLRGVSALTPQIKAAASKVGATECAK